MKELTKYKTRGLFLKYDEDGHTTTIHLPQGLIQDLPKAKFYKDDNKIIAELNGEQSQVYPSQIWERTTKKGIDIVIRIARTFPEISAGKKILLDHYMGIPSRGLFITAYKKEDLDKAKEAESKGSNGEKKEVEPVACGCLDRLYYAMPVGRKKIFEAADRKDLIDSFFDKKDGKSKQKDKTTDAEKEKTSDTPNRSYAVNDVRIAWISRIAVVKSERKHGIGSELATVMGTIAHDAMLPHADFIEVFMSYPSKPKSEDEEKSEYERRIEDNLFFQAKFKRYSDSEIKSPQMVFPEREESGYISTKKIYCYKDLRSEK